MTPDKSVPQPGDACPLRCDGRLQSQPLPIRSQQSDYVVDVRSVLLCDVCGR